LPPIKIVHFDFTSELDQTMIPSRSRGVEKPAPGFWSLDQPHHPPPFHSIEGVHDLVLVEHGQ
jgi:hypothetical protein